MPNVYRMMTISLAYDKKFQANRVGSKDNQISVSDYLYCPLTPPCVPFGTRRFVRIN